MIIAFLFNLIVLIIGAVFSILPQITTLPTIGGFDIDSALVSGMGELNAFMATFWFLKDLFIGFLVLMAYFSLKLIIRFLVGHRAPGSH